MIFDAESRPAYFYDKEKKMIITAVKIENVKRIIAASMELDGGCLIPISGRNGAGKSAMLEAIWSLITGNIPPGMVNIGSNGASLSARIGDYTVERTITVEDKTKKLVVTSTTDMVKNKPQTFLDTLTNWACLDPSWFLKQDNKKESLLKILGINLSEIDKRLNDMEEERRLTGQLVKSIGRIETIDYDPEYPSPVDIATEQKEALKWNNDQDLLQHNLDSQNDRIQEFVQSLSINQKIIESAKNEKAKLPPVLQLKNTKEIENKIKKLQEELEIALNYNSIQMKNEMNSKLISAKIETHVKEREQIVEDYRCAEEHLETMPKPEIKRDLNLFDRRIETATKNQTLKKESERMVSKREQKKCLQIKYDQISQDIKITRNERLNKLKSAGLPPNIIITQTGLEVNMGTEQRAIESLSFSESLIIALDICVAANPKLRVILLKNGSEFDKESLSYVEDFAKANNFQIFIEIVSENNLDMPGEIHIEAGEICLPQQ